MNITNASVYNITNTTYENGEDEYCNCPGAKIFIIIFL